jgi:hypothetical protein
MTVTAPSTTCPTIAATERPAGQRRNCASRPARHTSMAVAKMRIVTIVARYRWDCSMRGPNRWIGPYLPLHSGQPGQPIPELVTRTVLPSTMRQYVATAVATATTLILPINDLRVRDRNTASRGPRPGPRRSRPFGALAIGCS